MLQDWKSYTMLTLSPKKAGVTILDQKFDFKVQTIAKDKERHFMVIKELIHQGNIVLNFHACNERFRLHDGTAKKKNMQF